MSNDRPNSAVLADLIGDVIYAFLGTGLMVLGLLFIWAAFDNLLRYPSVGASLLTLFAAVVSFVLVGTGILVNPWTKRRLDRLHAPSTVGRARTVDERVVRPEERCTERCTACGDRVEAGLVRRRREEYVLFGVPLVTRSERFTHYCLDCATAELSGDDAVEAARDVDPSEFVLE
ncbi:hypothetical protein [Haloarchaeobius iranensis]|uniref:DUF8108 domain-containing protein n=1 Tax=Haloarchaeobius iranensis TaxID=996166 RepID=A0A1G9SB03_9EURY|nr:hypothetical protein [Haloarchaeobius iranensis]SDM32551.1 hypothetical protein SAMN05192554_10154 [Haloarchaeobius iranensis]